MTRNECDVLVTSQDHDRIMAHLFPGDDDEHGAILRAGVVRADSSLRLLIQHIQPARFGTEYVAGRYGYRALTPTFIHHEILRCRDSGLAYLAVHNHGSDREVKFSNIDLESHQRGYPALLDISRGLPVGALVYGHRSVAADIWLQDGARLSLGSYRVIGTEITRLYSEPRSEHGSEAAHDRQVRMFGAIGQHILAASKVAVIGLGGVGSIVAEYLARLGVGTLVLVDSRSNREQQPLPCGWRNTNRRRNGPVEDPNRCPPFARDCSRRYVTDRRSRRLPSLRRSTPAGFRLYLLGRRLHAGPACCQRPRPPVSYSHDPDWCKDTT